MRNYLTSHSLIRTAKLNRLNRSSRRITMALSGTMLFASAGASLVAVGNYCDNANPDNVFLFALLCFGSVVQMMVGAGLFGWALRK